MGFQQVVIDYIPSRTHPGLRKVFTWLLNAATVLVGVGLYEFETNDVGITEAVRRVWKA
jgi:succinate dehydrogenase (ubiquinone) membrane anchor subunit